MIGELRVIGSERLDPSALNRRRNDALNRLPKSSASDWTYSPGDEYVITRDAKGAALSIFADDIWDFSAYAQSVGDHQLRMHFGKLPEKIKGEVKWIMFVLLYVHAWDSTKPMRLGTSIKYSLAVRRLGWFANEQNISLFDIFASERHLVDAAQVMASSTLLRGFAAVVKHLHLIGPEHCGVAVVYSQAFRAIRNASFSLTSSQQVSLVPARIFSNVITSFSEFEIEIKEHIGAVCQFFVGVGEYVQATRKRPALKSYPSRYDFKSSLFETELEVLGLSVIFKKYEICNPRGLKRFLVQIQHFGKLMVHIYSGMRSQEAYSLKVGCLEKSQMASGVLYEFSGDTSKLTGGKKHVKWVTSQEVVNAVEILECIAKSANEFVGVPEDSIPLFLSTNYSEITTKPKIKDGRPQCAKFLDEKESVFSVLDSKPFQINEQDLNQLDKVNPFRAWGSEVRFKAGEVWRFTSHQFRRSLAVYAHRQGGVSLGALKRQMKHLNRNMTIYYAQAVEIEDEYNADQHFIHLLKGTKPEAEAAAFLDGIVNSNEELSGPQGRILQKGLAAEYANVVFDSPKNELVRMFRRGEISYKETALGACTSPHACDKRALRILSACVGCKDAVIKKSKLDNLVSHQSDFVEQLSPGTVEYKLERAELDALTSFQQQLSRGLLSDE